MNREKLSEFTKWYETLSPKSLDSIGDYYKSDAYFKDPFHSFNGIEGIKHIFTHMFETTKSPRFFIKKNIFDEQKQEAVLIWDFVFSINSRQFQIHGSTYLIFEGDKVIHHRDYWDVGEEVLEKIPIIRFFYKSLTKRFRVYESN